MSIIIKSIREAYEALKRIRQPPAEPPVPPQGWIAWDEPEAPPISPLAAEMIAGLEEFRDDLRAVDGGVDRLKGKYTIRVVHKDGRPTGGQS